MMKKTFNILLLFGTMASVQAQSILSLDSCRALALENNKELRIAKEKVTAAHYERKAAYTNYLPDFSAMGMYKRNQKNLSLINNDKKAALSNAGTTTQEHLHTSMENLIADNPDLANILGPLAGMDIATPLNAMGSSLANALQTSSRNIWVGGLTITQPLYLGGKIHAYNKITQYAEKLAAAQQDAGMQDVILNVDQAYWQVISLVNKKNLAESYLELVQKLDNDLDKMIREGLATRADGLSVKVKVNEAEMTLTQVDNGLSLSKMVLCQLCGLDLDTPILLVDEKIENLPLPVTTSDADVDFALSNRPELEGLTLAEKIYRQKVNVTRSEFLPSVALTGNYLATSPSAFNGIQTKFRGMWSLGVMVKVPIFHWGEGPYKVKSSKAEANIARYHLEEAREKIELQVNQSAYKVNEASRKLIMTERNMEKAEENLRYANLGFQEGVIPTSNVLEAQTAWLSAQSSKIDAQIDVKLTEIYLQKALGTLK